MQREKRKKALPLPSHHSVKVFYDNGRASRETSDSVKWSADNSILITDDFIKNVCAVGQLGHTLLLADYDIFRHVSLNLSQFYYL